MASLGGEWGLMKETWLNALWLGFGNAAMFPWLHFKTPLWQLQPQTWWALMFCLCNEPPPPPQLKCNYHLADTKMRFLACGHSRCYLEFFNFRRGNTEKRKKKLSFSLTLSLSLPCCPTFWGEPERKKGRATREERRVKRKRRGRERME